MIDSDERGLGLPPMPELMKSVYRDVFSTIRGVDGGGVLRSVRRRVLGDGERYDTDSRGRPKQFLARESVIRQVPVFYRERTSPELRLLMVIDLGFSGESDRASRKRLLQAATVIGAAAMTTPEIRLTLCTLGTSPNVAPTTLSGVAGAQLMRRVLTHLHAQSLQTQPFTPQQLALSCLADPRSHVVIVSHFIESSLLSKVNPPGGLSAFLVEPSGGPLGHGLGWRSPLALSGSRSQASEWYREQCEAVRQEMGHRCGVFVVSNQNAIIEDVGVALATSSKRRDR